MAYMNQERKATRLPEIKRILKKYNMKGTVSVRNHSTLVVTLSQGNLDIIGNYLENISETNRTFIPEKVKNIQVNEYYIDRDYSGKVREFLEELKTAMLGPDYYCHDEIQADYFDRSHYIDINVGKWNKQYIHIQK